MADSMSVFDKKVFLGVYNTILQDCHTPLAAELGLTSEFWKLT